MTRLEPALRGCEPIAQRRVGLLQRAEQHGRHIWEPDFRRAGERGREVEVGLLGFVLPVQGVQQSI